MAKKGSKNSTVVKNLLRLSGMIFAVMGGFHILRYYKGWDFKIGEFELTFFGSLIAGALLLILSAACFLNSKD